MRARTLADRHREPRREPLGIALEEQLTTVASAEALEIDPVELILRMRDEARARRDVGVETAPREPFVVEGQVLW